jgi:hypothetical protein
VGVKTGRSMVLGRGGGYKVYMEICMPDSQIWLPRASGQSLRSSLAMMSLGIEPQRLFPHDLHLNHSVTYNYSLNSSLIRDYVSSFPRFVRNVVRRSVPKQP